MQFKEADTYLWKWATLSQVLKPENQELNLWCHPDAQPGADLPTIIKPPKLSLFYGLFQPQQNSSEII